MALEALLRGHGSEWDRVLVGAVVAVVLALVALQVVLLVLRRVVRFSPYLTALITKLARPAHLIVPLVALQVTWGAAPETLAYLSAIAQITTVLLIASATWAATAAVQVTAAAVIRLHPATVSDNLEARRVQTQTRVLARTVNILLVLLGAGAALMIFPAVRQVGASLLASAGVAGLVLGIAARPVIGSLIAGLQIALTQPIRLDDVVIMQDEWGRIEEITATYVVVKIWDERRLVVPLQWIIEHPFQNWTRREAQLLGSVMLWVDYSVVLPPLRAELERVCKESPDWDGRVALLQVVEAGKSSLQLRALVSSADASRNWDLRCRVREALIEFLKAHQPHALPRVRAEVEESDPQTVRKTATKPPQRTGRGDSSAIRHPLHAARHAPESARAETGQPVVVAPNET